MRENSFWNNVGQFSKLNGWGETELLNCSLIIWIRLRSTPFQTCAQATAAPYSECWDTRTNECRQIASHLENIIIVLSRRMHMFEGCFCLARIRMMTMIVMLCTIRTKQCPSCFVYSSYLWYFVIVFNSFLKKSSISNSQWSSFLLLWFVRIYFNFN